MPPFTMSLQLDHPQPRCPSATTIGWNPPGPGPRWACPAAGNARHCSARHGSHRVPRLCGSTAGHIPPLIRVCAVNGHRNSRRGRLISRSRNSVFLFGQHHHAAAARVVFIHRPRRQRGRNAARSALRIHRLRRQNADACRLPKVIGRSFCPSASTSDITGGLDSTAPTWRSTLPRSMRDAGQPDRLHRPPRVVGIRQHHQAPTPASLRVTGAPALASSTPNSETADNVTVASRNRCSASLEGLSARFRWGFVLPASLPSTHGNHAVPGKLQSHPVHREPVPPPSDKHPRAAGDRREITPGPRITGAELNR